MARGRSRIQIRIDRPNWQKDAACRGMGPDLFYPEKHDSKAPILAKKICASCPVKEPCQQHGLAYESFGIWGGASERRRRQVRRQLNAS